MEVDQTREKLERLKEERLQKKKEVQQRGEKLSEQALKMVKKRNVKPFWERWGDPIGYTAIALVVVGLVVLNYTGDRRHLHQILVNDDSFIQAHNEGTERSYIVGANEHFQGMSLQEAQKAFANDLSPRKSISKCEAQALKEIDFPKHYNFYESYPECRGGESLRKDASAYVQTPLGVYKDRICSWEVKSHPTPSLDFLLRCNTKANRGAKGGYLLSTLYFMRKGFVGEECWKNAAENQPEGTCPIENLKSCQQVKVSEYCQLEEEVSIKREITQNGPVVSLIRPYRDFLIYKSGIYEARDQSKLEGVALIKVIGWGENENGVRYWLVDPLWGQSWGEEGVGKVKVNSEESLIEKYAFTLYPEISPKDRSHQENERVFAKPNTYIETE